MKALVALSTLFVVSSCVSTLQYIPAETTYYAIDFRKYTREGFLITPEKYLGDYESIGTVEYVMVPEARYQVTIKNWPDGSTEKFGKWVSNHIPLSQGVDSLYSIAKLMGADAIMNFSTTTITRNYSGIANPVTLTGSELSGFAIRRKPK